jgi:hypothetical protein
MEKIIHFKAKKKKLIYKTGILENFAISDEDEIRINNLANGFFLPVIILAYMIIISLKYFILIAITFNWMNIHFI